MPTCGFTRPGAFSVPCNEAEHLACNGKCWQHCEFGLQQYVRQLNLFNHHIPRWQIDQQFEKLMDEWIQHAIDVHGLPDNRHKTTPNGKYKGPFAFTMTMSPSDGLTEEDMILACRKVMDQKSQPVKKFAWYLEYKDESTKAHPHIHGMYETETGRRIERKHWKRQWSIWDETIPLGQGFRGGYHRPVRSNEAYSNYIAKQGGIGESNI